MYLQGILSSSTYKAMILHTHAHTPQKEKTHKILAVDSFHLLPKILSALPLF